MKKSICIIAVIGLFLPACGSEVPDEASQGTASVDSVDAAVSDVNLSEDDQLFADDYVEMIKSNLESNRAEGIIADEELTCYGESLVAEIGTEVLEQHEITPFQVSSNSDGVQLTDKETKASLAAEKDCFSYKSYFVAAVAWDGYTKSDAECVADEFNQEDFDIRTEMLLERANTDLDDDRKNEIEAAFDVMEGKFEAAIDKCDAQVENDRFEQPVKPDSNEGPVTTVTLDR